MTSALGLGVLLLAAPLHAQDSSNQAALAEALFREARELMQAERYGEACAKFAESQRLDPGGGTLLNLAVCHEAEGKTATAWAEFQEALATARSDARRDRMELAQQHIDGLEPRLSKVTIHVAEDLPEGLSVSINSTKVGAAGWGSEVPVDPGTVELRAEAPDHEPFTKAVEIEEGEKLTLEIPPLLPSSGDASAGSGADEGPASRSGSKTAAYVVGAVGLAALGVGSYFGVRAMQEKSEADDNQCTDKCYSSKGHDADKNAVFNGWLSTGGLGVGLAALGVATYLYLDSDAPAEAPPGAAAASNARPYALVPAVSDSGAAVWLTGSF